MKGILRQTMTIAAAALTVAFATGCGDDDDDPSGPASGTYTAKVTGDVQADLSGEAAFGQDTDPEFGTVFAIALGTDEEDEEGAVVFARRSTNRPATGNYQLADLSSITGNPPADQFFVFYVSGNDEDLSAFLVGTGGRLQITASSEQRVAGTFEFDATGFSAEDPENELEVSVTGAFNARAATAASARVTSAALSRALRAAGR